MRIAILGYGKEGKSLFRLRKLISPLDKAEKIEIFDGQKKKWDLKTLAKFDFVLRSPGIPYNLPIFTKLKKRNIQISSATKLFFEIIKNDEELREKSIIIGITGTKGKGTVTVFLYQLLKKKGEKVYLGGNIGIPALEIIPKLKNTKKKRFFVVLELSSFQLQDLNYSPDIAVITEIFPDHLDKHKSVKEYYEAKSNITRYQKNKDSVFYFADNKISKRIAYLSKGKKIAFNPKKFSMFTPKNIKLKGWHNFKNLAIAALTANYLGVPASLIKKEVVRFKGLPHRLELVAKINGVEIYNDSASTNPNTTKAALLSFPNKEIILICGGQDKELNYMPLKEGISRAKVKSIVLIGENKEKILNIIGKMKLNIQKAKDLKEAFRKALSKSQNGNIIIFSPGAASFDMFESYVHRGEEFRRVVLNTKKAKIKI